MATSQFLRGFPWTIIGFQTIWKRISMTTIWVNYCMQPFNWQGLPWHKYRTEGFHSEPSLNPMHDIFPHIKCHVHTLTFLRWGLQYLKIRHQTGRIEIFKDQFASLTIVYENKLSPACLPSFACTKSINKQGNIIPNGICVRNATQLSSRSPYVWGIWWAMGGVNGERFSHEAVCKPSKGKRKSLNVELLCADSASEIDFVSLTRSCIPVGNLCQISWHSYI